MDRGDQDAAPDPGREILPPEAEEPYVSPVPGCILLAVGALLLAVGWLL